MIIYFLRATGEIVGTQGGRVHQPEELSMYMGDPAEVDRIIVEWKPTKYMKQEDGSLTAIEWQPNCEEDMIPLIESFEKDPMKMHREYRVNPANKRFFRKRQEEIEQAKAQEKDDVERLKQRHQKKLQKMAVVADKKAKIEDRFEALLDLLNLKAQV